MAYSGKFVPKNPDKYTGNVSTIIYRSLWEFKLMKYLDAHDEIVKWASEEIIIPYRSPIDRRMHRYFPDFWVQKKSGEQLVIEVKPKQQLKPPKKPKRQTQRYLREVHTFAINQRKFEVAEEFCRNRGMKFVIFTQDELGIIG
jgi:hypothetical protein